MLRLIAAFNALLGVLLDALLRPMAALPPMASLAVVSLLTAVVMLLVVRRTSDQGALDEVKRRIHAALFEIRLFNDDLRAIFRAQGDMLRHNLTYLRLSLAPMLWMIVPFVFVIAQLQFRYGYDGLEVGRPVTVTAHLRAASSDAPAIEAPPGLRVDTNAIWFPAAQEVLWRVTPLTAGDFDIGIRAAGQTHVKHVHVSDRVARRSPDRLEAGYLNEILYPAESPLPRDAAITSISVPYPERELDVFGWKVNWLIAFLALSIVFAFALRKPFGVTL